MPWLSNVCSWQVPVDSDIEVRHSGLSTGSRLQDLAQSLPHYEVFVGLQHPDAHDDYIWAAGQSGAGGSTAGGRIQFDRWRALAHCIHYFGPSDLNSVLIVSDQEVGNMIGDWRDKNLGLDSGQVAQATGDPFSPATVLFFHGCIVLAQEPVHRSYHAHDLLFGDF